MYTIDRAMSDKRLLGAALDDVTTWTTWLAILKAAFGLPLSEEQQEIFAAVAGGRDPPTKRVRELWCIAGRRSGKSRMAAMIAVYLAMFVKHRLSPGEKGMVLVLAASKDQARVVFGYARAFLIESRVLRQEVEAVTASEIRLRNGITLAVHANSFRTVRGRTLCAAIFDEVALWHDDLSATPDKEIYSAVLPSLITTRGMLVGISTAYRRMGLLFQKHRDYFGVASDDILVVQGSTFQFNKTLDEAAIAAQRAADPAAAASEWDGMFRNDVGAFLDDDLIDAAVEHGRPLEVPPVRGSYVYYRAFIDAAGGVGGDGYAIAVGHKEAGHYVIDAVRGTTGRFDPLEVTRQYAALVREYRIHSVCGDHYAAEWVAGVWRRCNVNYKRSELPKSQLYLETTPLFARGLVRLPDHPHLLRELRLLERHTHRSGRDTVDHPRGGHDDHANCCCGVLYSLSRYPGYDLSYSGFQDDGDVDQQNSGDGGVPYSAHYGRMAVTGSRS